MIRFLITYDLQELLTCHDFVHWYESMTCSVSLHLTLMTWCYRLWWFEARSLRKAMIIWSGPIDSPLWLIENIDNDLHAVQIFVNGNELIDDNCKSKMSSYQWHRGMTPLHGSCKAPVTYFLSFRMAWMAWNYKILSLTCARVMMRNEAVGAGH